MPFFGGGAGDYIIVGTNIKGGNLALPAVIGDNNMGLGNGAGQSVVNADRNIFIGNEAGKLVETQNDNTIIGQFAGNASVDAISDSTLIGSNLLAGLNSSVTDSLVMSRNGLIGSRFAASVFLHSGSANFFADLSNSIFVGSNQDGDGLTDTTLTDSVYVGMGGRFIATSVNLASSALVGTGHTISGSLSNVFGIGKGLMFSAGNAIGIGKDMTVAGNEIRIGDASHTSVVIGGVTLNSPTGTVLPGAVGIGGATPVTSGITFPAVAVDSAGPNTLDDYEEGTFTPGFTCATPGDLAIAAPQGFGVYRKIGRTVFFSLQYSGLMTYTTASGEIRLTGLPFTVGFVGNAQYVASALVEQWIAPANFTGLAAVPAVNQTYITFTRQRVNGGFNANVTITEFATNKSHNFIISGFYTVP